MIKKLRKIFETISGRRAEKLKTAKSIHFKRQFDYAVKTLKVGDTRIVGGFIISRPGISAWTLELTKGYI